MCHPTLRKGFTLIEVAVVLVALAILTAIAIPTFTTFMNRTDANTAEAEALALVANAVSVSSLDGYRCQSDPAAAEDTIPFGTALEQVDSESGSDASGDYLDYTNADGDLTGDITVRGSRDTYYFTVDLLTCALGAGSAPAVVPAATPPTISFLQNNTYTTALQGLDLQISENGSDVTALSATVDINGVPTSGTFSVASGSDTSEVYRASWLKSSGIPVNAFYTVSYSYEWEGQTYSGSDTAYLSDDITAALSIAATDGGATMTVTGDLTDPDPVTSWYVYVACTRLDSFGFYSGSTTGVSPDAGTATVTITNGAPVAGGSYRCQVILADDAGTGKALYGWPTFTYSG